MGGGVCAGGPVADVQSVVMLPSVIHFRMCVVICICHMHANFRT